MEDTSEININKAFKSYAEGKISLQKVSRIAGITYMEALEELKRQTSISSTKKRGLVGKYRMGDEIKETPN